MMSRAHRICLICLVIIGCGPHAGAPRDGSTGDAITSDGANCAPDNPDQAGCACAPASPPRACYPGDPTTRNVGVCRDGTQSCDGNGEFGTYGACTGAVTPGTENCTNGLDDNCDGRIDCADPTCATDPACRTGCTDGQTRSCYDGPSGTENVGSCKDGTQVCAGGMWPASCPGEVLPQPQDCASPIDKACNHLPGCFNIFVCATNPACMETCQVTNPACVCPNGTGDAATCPDGMHGVHNGGIPGTIECCPCTVNDCSDAGCCAETVCVNSPQCGGLTCRPLPPSCHGQVNLDCDDFPEDCDEPCCKCSNC